MTDPVLDASAVLAVIFGEPGADRVAGHLPGARISAVNATEVMTKLIDLGMPEDIVDAIFEGLQLTVLPSRCVMRARLRGYGRSHVEPVCRSVIAPAWPWRVSSRPQRSRPIEPGHS